MVTYLKTGVSTTDYTQFSSDFDDSIYWQRCVFDCYYLFWVQFRIHFIHSAFNHTFFLHIRSMWGPFFVIFVSSFIFLVTSGSNFVHTCFCIENKRISLKFLPESSFGMTQFEWKLNISRDKRSTNTFNHSDHSINNTKKSTVLL